MLNFTVGPTPIEIKFNDTSQERITSISKEFGINLIYKNTALS